jgi:uncharacterized phosphosugar-binding protein
VRAQQSGDLSPGGIYLQLINDLVDQLVRTQLGSIDRAAELVASAISNGGRVWVAESDHILAGEATYRAGGLLAVERLGIIFLANGSPSLERRDGAPDPSSIDVAIFASSAGADRRSVELALMCQALGIQLIVLASSEFASAAGVTSRHSSGLKLRDLADVYIDIGGRAGDAAIELPGLSEPVCPSSGVISVAAMWAIFASAVSRMLPNGAEPLVYRSVMSPGGDELYQKLEAEYATLGVGYRRIGKR